MENIIELSNELKVQILDLQVYLYLERMHRYYSEHRIVDCPDDIFEETLNILEGNVNDRLSEIDCCIKNLLSILLTQ